MLRWAEARQRRVPAQVGQVEGRVAPPAVFPIYPAETAIVAPHRIRQVRVHAAQAQRHALAPGVRGGAIYALGSVAWLFGAVLVNRVTLRLGPGPTMLLGALLIGVANLLVPLAGVLLEAALPLLVCRFLLLGIANPLYNVTSTSMQQTLTPPRLFGRVNASMEFIGVGTLPLGALVGGILAETLGVGNALLIGALGGLLAVLWLLLSPVRSLR